MPTDPYGIFFTKRMKELRDHYVTRSWQQAPAAFEAALAAADAAAHQINVLPGLRCLSPEHLCWDAAFTPAVDPLKLTVCVRGLGISGSSPFLLH